MIFFIGMSKQQMIFIIASISLNTRSSNPFDHKTNTCKVMHKAVGQLIGLPLFHSYTDMHGISPQRRNIMRRSVWEREAILGIGLTCICIIISTEYIRSDFTKVLVTTKMRQYDENDFMHSSGGEKERQSYELANCSMHQYTRICFMIKRIAGFYVCIGQRKIGAMVKFISCFDIPIKKIYRTLLVDTVFSLKFNVRL